MKVQSDLPNSQVGLKKTQGSSGGGGVGVGREWGVERVEGAEDWLHEEEGLSSW